MLPEPLNTFKKKPLQSLYVLGLVLLGVAGWIWWGKISTAPERVFWDTLGQSLATSAVTIQAEQGQNGSSLRQTVQYSLGASNITRSLTTLTQGNTTVVDELIGTPTTDYTRYLSVHTDQKTAAGRPLDFSKVLGVWAKNDAKADPASGSGVQLFSQAVLGSGLPIGGVAVPIANLQPGARASLMKQIKDNDVYQTDFHAVKVQHHNGRLQYVYNVKIQAVAYAALMQSFAKATGLHDLDSLDPASFEGQSSLPLQITVDVRSRHVVTAYAPFSKATQTYTSYDVPVSMAPPTKAITVQQLQERLTSLQ